MKKYLLLAGIIFFISGCAVKTRPVYAVIKTPKIKMADQGFLKEGFLYKKIILYKGLKSIEISLYPHSVCMNKECVPKSVFIEKFFGPEYPDDFLDKIIKGKPLSFIRDGKRFVYKVTPQKVLFKDREKRIVIIIKFL